MCWVSTAILSSSTSLLPSAKRVLRLVDYSAFQLSDTFWLPLCFYQRAFASPFLSLCINRKYKIKCDIFHVASHQEHKCSGNLRTINSSLLDIVILSMNNNSTWISWAGIESHCFRSSFWGPPPLVMIFCSCPPYQCRNATSSIPTLPMRRSRICSYSLING